MVYLQLVSSYSPGTLSTMGPIIGPYEKIEFDYKCIRLFDGVSNIADCIYYWEDEGGFYYGGSLYNRYCVADDLRKLRDWKSCFQIYDSSKTKIGEIE